MQQQNQQRLTTTATTRQLWSFFACAKKGLQYLIRAVVGVLESIRQVK
jgi:hypothetical protein